MCKLCNFNNFLMAKNHISKSLRPKVLYHFGKLFWCTQRYQGQLVCFQFISNDFPVGGDLFTKSGGHARILRLEPPNFAWDLVWSIHMPYKKSSSIREQKVILTQPNQHSISKCYINKLTHGRNDTRKKIEFMYTDSLNAYDFIQLDINGFDPVLVIKGLQERK